MGLDGGTIITRNDVLRGQCWDLAKADDSRSSRGGCVRGTFKRRKLDPRTARATRWSTCALSGQPLAAPVVACFLGSLYNKAAVLEWVLARSGRFAEEADIHKFSNQLRDSAGAFDHITSLRDVFDVQYPSAAAGPQAPVLASASSGSVDPLPPAPFTCPISQLRCDCYPFAALCTCGHVFSERALTEAGADGTCPTCGEPFNDAEDVIPLLPSDEQLEKLRQQLPTRRKQQKARAKRRLRHEQGRSMSAEGQQQGEREEQQGTAQLQRRQQEQKEQQRRETGVPRQQQSAAG